MGALRVAFADLPFLSRRRGLHSEIDRGEVSLAQVGLIRRRRLVTRLKNWHCRFVGEESYSKGASKDYLITDEPTWCVDPLDGNNPSLRESPPQTSH